jgi:N-acetylmuramoyl-L-alanine amidase
MAALWGLLFWSFVSMAEAQPTPPSGWVRLNYLAARQGLTARSEGLRRWVAWNRSFRVELEEKSRRMVFNGVSVYLNAEVRRSGSDWLITSVDANTILMPLLTPSASLVAVGSQVVLLDPGHGGDDPGAPGPDRTPEKKTTLDIARRVRAKLKDTGITVRLTRESDHILPLESRIFAAKQAPADLLVSIHFNSSGNRTVSGVETYMMPAPGFSATTSVGASRRPPRPVSTCSGSRFGAMNSVLAWYLHKGMVSAIGADDRGVRQANFYVLRNAPCPAVLVECGYLSNGSEGSRILTEAHRERIATGVARGIMTYVSRSRENKAPRPIEMQ